MALNINKLIESAEQLTTDPQLGFAATIQSLIQEVTADDGTRYQLQVVITCDPAIMVRTE
jgi:hypothetical protein